MLINRVKQFFWSICSLIMKEDFSIINNYLNQSQLNLFMNINKSERQHSIRVCKAALSFIEENNIYGIDKDKMAKCALLHDIGKSQAKLNVFEKSIIIILNSITSGKFLKYNKNKKIQNYYNHPGIGRKLLIDNKETDKDILICVNYHHKKCNKDKNIYLEILIMCDNNN